VNAPHRRGLPRRVYKPDDLLALQGHSDKVNEAIMMIEANVEVLTALRKYYESLLRHKDFTMKGSCEEEVLTFTNQINDMIYDKKMQASRAKLLVQITKDRKDIVSNICLYPVFATNSLADTAASSNTDNGSNGGLDKEQYERISSDANYHRGHITVSPSNLRIGKPMMSVHDDNALANTT
jgi:hypothetical protein